LRQNVSISSFNQFLKIEILRQVKYVNLFQFVQA
jgi:hypothetical protein